ncbi:MAG: SRPBCC family protein [Saprospiraceae bacterium]|nr:SRPBCC family protein [Saprospiraceae bacterium]
MKPFQCSVVIDRPLSTVVELFKDPENLRHWQDGFIGLEHLSGSPGTAGAKTRFRYRMGKGEMELIETIIRNDLPREFAGEYWHKSMTNTMRYWFEPVADDQTRYNSEVHYTEFRGLTIKVMAFLFPGVFKRQVQKWMNQFKAFVEQA